MYNLNIFYKKKEYYLNNVILIVSMYKYGITH